MLSPIITYTVMIPAMLQIYIHIWQDMSLAKKWLKYNLPHIINDIPELILEK